LNQSGALNPQSGAQQPGGLTAVVDGVGHDGLQPPGEASVAVGQEGREHEAGHAEVHLLRLQGRGAAHHAALVVWGGGGFIIIIIMRKREMIITLLLLLTLLSLL